MARYAFLPRQAALEAGLITENSSCRKSATEVVLTEDEVSRLGNFEEIVQQLNGRILSTKQALKELEKKEWNF